MSLVSSYHSTTTQARDTSYFKKSTSFRDLIKTQNDKENKLEALKEMGNLEDTEYTELGLKGIELHRFMQDRRQIYRDAALTKANGPIHVRPGGPARFEKEVRYAASIDSIETMQLFWKSAQIMTSRYLGKELRLTGRNATQLTLHFRFHVSLVTNRLLT
jgi:hypothetical protein